MADPHRLDDLRRRVHKDPASLAFAQLAEECRRVGQLHEAVRVCRQGLAHHPDYLSARVTLGRALIGLEHFDQAAAELSSVLRTAPENLAALRGLAELHDRQGQWVEALEYYRSAHRFAPLDGEIAAAIERLEHEARPVAPLPVTPLPVAPLPVALPAPPSDAAPASGPSPALPVLERWLNAIEARRRRQDPGAHA